MFSNEQVTDYVVELMQQFQGHINIMEKELTEEEVDNKIIGVHLGKLSQIYALVCELTGVFTGVDWREGGFKESSRFSRDKKLIKADEEE